MFLFLCSIHWRLKKNYVAIWSDLQLNLYVELKQMKSEAVQVKKLDRIVLIQTRIPGYVLYKYKQIANMSYDLCSQLRAKAEEICWFKVSF